jgi:uncharacterized membrane protein YdjX (TVP38/TMEM64 family)
MLASTVTPLPEWWLSFLTWVSHLGPWGLLLFIAAYVVATLCFAPAWILRFGAGVAFGAVGGTVVASVGGVLGALASFGLARKGLGPFLLPRLEGSLSLRALDRAIERRGLWIVIVLRACPIIPNSLLNYLLALTSLRLRAYLISSWIGMLPGVVLYACLGSMGRSELLAVLHHRWNGLAWALWSSAIAIALIVIAELAGQWRARVLLELREVDDSAPIDP